MRKLCNLEAYYTEAIRAAIAETELPLHWIAIPERTHTGEALVALYTWGLALDLSPFWRAFYRHSGLPDPLESIKTRVHDLTTFNTTIRSLIQREIDLQNCSEKLLYG